MNEYPQQELTQNETKQYHLAEPYDIINDTLFEKLKPYQFPSNNDTIEAVTIANRLIKSLIKYNALGAAANQFGLDYNVFAIFAEPSFVMFNPKIVAFSDEQVLLDEGCISYPGLFLKIKRPANIRVRYTTPYNQTITSRFGGMSARVIQHEYDHLNGICFWQKVSYLKLKMALEKANKKHNQHYKIVDFWKKL